MYFNALAISLILLLMLSLSASLIFPALLQPDHFEEGDLNIRATGSEVPLSGEEIPVKGGRFVKYSVTENVSSNDWRKGTNISIVDTLNGRTHKILPDGDARSLQSWELIYRNNDGKPEAFAYLAWAATEDMTAKGRGDLLIAGFPDLKQYVVARNTKYNDAPRVHGDGSIAMILWREETSAEFVVFDFIKGEITKRVKVDLPVIPANQLQQSEGPIGDPLRPPATVR